MRITIWQGILSLREIPRSKLKHYRDASVASFRRLLPFSSLFFQTGKLSGQRLHLQRDLRIRPCYPPCLRAFLSPPPPLPFPPPFIRTGSADSGSCKKDTVLDVSGLLSYCL